MVAEYRTESVPIDSIEIPQTHRSVRQESVETLTKSISTIGLINPVTLTSGYRLVAGRHRIEAHRKLGYKTIEARLLDADDLLLELAEIDENMERSQLDALQFSQQLKRRKEIYEGMHPDKKHGGSRKSAGNHGEISSPQNADLKSFAEDTAETLGVSRATVERAIHVAENIPEDVQEEIANTPIAESKAELAALAKLPEAQQRKAVEKVKSGKAKSVRAAAPKARTAKNGQPTVDVRKFVALEKHIGKAVRMNSDIKGACGGAEFHEQVRSHLNNALKALAAWRKSKGAA